MEGLLQLSRRGVLEDGDDMIQQPQGDLLFGNPTCPGLPGTGRDAAGHRNGKADDAPTGS